MERKGDALVSSLQINNCFLDELVVIGLPIIMTIYVHGWLDRQFVSSLKGKTTNIYLNATFKLKDAF